MLIGIDICSTARLIRALSRSPFLKEEVFSPAEIAYCEGQSRPIQHYSGRWAAKEACLKAFGLNILGVNLNQIEVVRSSGSKPLLRINDESLHQTMQTILPNFMVQVTLSHEEDYSVAVVLAVAGNNTPS
jgi:holo-[acyl-carrier protein] synthase